MTFASIVAPCLQILIVALTAVVPASNYLIQRRLSDAKIDRISCPDQGHFSFLVFANHSESFGWKYSSCQSDHPNGTIMETVEPTRRFILFLQAETGKYGKKSQSIQSFPTVSLCVLFWGFFLSCCVYIFPFASRFTLAHELHPDWMLLLFFTHTHLTVTVTLGLLLVPKVGKPSVFKLCAASQNSTPEAVRHHVVNPKPRRILLK